jgi:hypothetical protein
MARRNIRRPELEPHQRALALMIDDALNRGQRGDGENEKHWARWNNRSLADASRGIFSENAVANWRDPDRRMPPEDIKPLLKLFYGTIERFKDDRAKMERLWRLARGYIVDDEAPASGWAAVRTQNLQGQVDLVRLHTHQPVPWNDGTLRLAITLVITPDQDVSYRGRAVIIGLSEALLRLDASGLQPAYKALPSQRGLPHFVPSAAGDRIIGPLDRDTSMINGEPLGDEFLLSLENLATEPDDKPATVAVCASRGSFRVLPRSMGGNIRQPAARRLANQNAVVNALFFEQYRERDDHDRAVLARARIGGGTGECR